MRAARNSMCEISRETLNHVSFSGSGRSQWRILAVTKKDLISSPCSASALCLQQKCDMKHQRNQHKHHLTPLPPTERPRKCIAHLFSQLQPGKHAHLLPTQVLSIFVSGSFAPTVNKLSCPAAAWASPSFFRGAHGPGMRQGRQGWSPAQLLHPAHGGNRSLHYRLEHSPSLNSQGPELT